MSGQFQSFQPRNPPNEPFQKAVRGYIAADTQLQPCYSARCENKTTVLDKLRLPLYHLPPELCAPAQAVPNPLYTSTAHQEVFPLLCQN